MNRRRSRQRVVLAAVLAAALGVPLLGAVPAYAGSAPVETSALQRKAESGVLADLAAKERVSFWVQLDSQADTSAARKQKDKADKGRAVLQAKQEHAERSQAGLKALLKQAHAPYESYWISNTVKVTGDKALAEKIAARDDVAAIQADDPIELPDPLPGTDEAKVDGIEWNIDRVGAPKVWDELGDRGEGVVIGSIDTGVDHDHPALLHSYRGLRSDGTVDHAYNWFDPTGVCAEQGGGDPCDPAGHGTHTLGTMVGDDGAGNRIGMAPGATWIAAKGCGTDNCPQSALLASGQWMLAPTDANGRNPRPDLAPDVINNSWGGATLDTWYKAMVQAWRDAGIFPAFSNGNLGPTCDGAGAPGAYTNSYASGAFDIANKIAPFSSRGPGENGTVKPDIAAPGVNVRSAVPGGGYEAKSGTSMASPHTAATVALMWSASPSLRGDVAATEVLLNQTAIDVDATGCGGTAARNNVYGDGRLDAYAAVSAAPRASLGSLTGTVTSGGEPVGDAEVRLDGVAKALARTAKDGTYTLPRVIAGDYTVSVAKFGFTTAKWTVTVTTGQTANGDTALVVAPTGTLTGKVTSASGAEADVVIRAEGTPARTTTRADGTYTLTLPVGDYQVTATPRNKCAAGTQFAVGMTTAGSAEDLALTSRTDAFGTTCRQTADPFPTGGTVLAMSSPYGGYASIDLPFPIALYGRTYQKAAVAVDGMLTFDLPNLTGANGPLPTTGSPNGTLYPFWDDLRMDDASAVLWSTRGTAGHRELVVEWRNMMVSRTPERRIGFAAVISEDGTYSFHYQGVEAGGLDDELGAFATVGAENREGTDAFQYSFKQVSLRDGMSVEFSPERSAAVSGTVADANDGKPIPGATVTVTRGTTTVATLTPRADGAYLTQLPVSEPAEYTVRIAAPNYEPVTRTATLQGLSVLWTAAALRTGVVTSDNTAGFTLVVPPGQNRQRTFTLSNAGSAADYTVKEKSGRTWLTATPAAGRLDAGAKQQVTLTFDTANATPGTVLTGTLVVTSASGRAPTTELPLKVIVPAYRTAVNAGPDGTQPVLDAAADTWTTDQPWTAGSYGQVGSTEWREASKDIAGTTEQQLFRTGRLGATEYRFDNVPNGVYQVELGFAELSGAKPGRRVFDVLAEGAEKVSNVDIALEAGGPYRALTKTFTVTVTDGQLNVEFAAVTGQTLVNSIRVTQRPDLR
ncbi:S8 family serine peptidase [Streptomyces sp. NPDC051940]|uniref:S8 family serine peptidase n=1 Tax=Streptomyces sp. NPDC051940 TaxID=3155675 RepID=UPI0034224999